MPLETGTYLPDLNASNPAHTDSLNQADAHLRLIKATIKNTFPNFTDVALNSTQAAIDAAVTSLAGVFKVAVDGAIGAPAYTFASETGLGFYRKAANTLALAIAGVDVWKISGAGVDIITAGALLAGGVAIFPLQAANIGALQVTTAALAANAITYAKMQQAVGTKVLVGASAPATNLSEITLGTGLDIIAGALTNTQNPQPPIAHCTNLLIGNDGTNPNTKINLSVDAAVLYDGSGNTQRAFNLTTSVDFTTTGAGGCDVGTRAANKGYYIWLIGNGSTVTAIAMLDTAGGLTLPGGYTKILRVGWYRTDGSSNLYRIDTAGPHARYLVNGAGNATQFPLAASGFQASPSSKTLAGLVSPLAQRIALSLYNAYNSGTLSTVAISPNTTFSTAGATTNPPISMVSSAAAGAARCDFVPEALSFGYQSSDTGGAAFVIGWDNPF